MMEMDLISVSTVASTSAGTTEEPDQKDNDDGNAERPEDEVTKVEALLIIVVLLVVSARAALILAVTDSVEKEIRLEEEQNEGNNDPNNDEPNPEVAPTTISSVAVFFSNDRLVAGIAFFNRLFDSGATGSSCGVLFSGRHVSRSILEILESISLTTFRTRHSFQNEQKFFSKFPKNFSETF